MSRSLWTALEPLRFGTFNVYPELIHGVEDGLYHGGYTMILANGNYDPEKERESIRRMLNQGIAGLIVEPMASAAVTPDNRFITDLNKAGVPIITTNCIIEGLTLHSCARKKTPARSVLDPVRGFAVFR